MPTTSVLPPSCDISEYSILSVRAERTPAENSSSFQVRPEIRFEDGKKPYDVLLTIQHIVSGFSFSCSIEGRFTFHEAISSKNVLHAWVNGCTILYGIARGLYSSAASQCIHKSLMLPTVMMVDAVRRRIEELKPVKQSAKS